MIQTPPRAVIRAALPELLDFLGKLGQVPVGRSVAVTSWYRDPTHNAAVGGHPQSQHLLGLAIDLVAGPGDGPAVAQAARAVGLIAVEEGDHIHLQARPAGTSGALLAAIGLG